ncbi:MAG: 50S ribosomal protein L4, partial [Dehalococcoidia bacterium]|nr:50S ribosomal protein L4 [Dehalococcoidia bacterium]
MDIEVRNKAGEVVSSRSLNDRVFGAAAKEAMVHQALVRQLADARLGTASTKTRSMVAGSTRKLYAQKHTGRARAGAIRAPQRKGSGIAFGPHPRDYSQAMPKKMRRAALRSVLSAKAAQGEVIVLDGLDFDQPKTKQMAELLRTLGVASSAIIATAQVDANVVKSARNLQGITTMPAAQLNVGDLLSHKILILTADAL